MELYRKYRPRSLGEIAGQQDTVRMLESFLKRKELPHALLFSGPSGCGKTTIARILKREMGCDKLDYQEINAAESRGIDTIREIAQHVGLSPIAGKCRMWIMDEAHQLNSFSQNALLKLLEDTPDHVYFILCTTDPAKLIRTIYTRCTHCKLGTLYPSDLAQVIKDVVERSKETVQMPGADVIKAIIEAADGSARKAVVLLGQVADLVTKEEQLAAIQKPEVQQQAIELARLLINPKTKWPAVAELIKNLDESPEGIRHLILSYASTVVLGGGSLSSKGYLLLTCFESPWYDSGKAGLVRACYEVFSKH